MSVVTHMEAMAPALHEQVHGRVTCLEPPSRAGWHPVLVVEVLLMASSMNGSYFIGKKTLMLTDHHTSRSNHVHASTAESGSQACARCLPGTRCFLGTCCIPNHTVVWM